MVLAQAPVTHKWQSQNSSPGSPAAKSGSPPCEPPGLADPLVKGRHLHGTSSPSNCMSCCAFKSSLLLTLPIFSRSPCCDIWVLSSCSSSLQSSHLLLIKRSFLSGTGSMLERGNSLCGAPSVGLRPRPRQSDHAITPGHTDGLKKSPKAPYLTDLSYDVIHQLC